MTARKVEVEAVVRIVLEFDDEVVSDWDGRTLLQIHENEDRYLPGATQADALAGAAVTIGLWGSRDGYADFPVDAVRARIANEFPEIQSVTLDGEVL
jgi:hypothetical protein